MAFALFPKAQNFAQEIVVHGCARPWFIYVTTFFPSFLQLVLMLAFIDLEDLMRDYAKNLVKTGYGSGRNVGHRYKPAVKPVTNKINRWSQKGLKTLLIVTEPLEKIGFAWLLYNTTESFFYNWQTALERSIYCDDGGSAGPFQRSRPVGGNVVINQTGAATVCAVLEQNRAQWTNTGIRVDLPRGQYTAIFSITVAGPLGDITGVRAQLRITGSLGPTIIEGPSGDLAQGEQGSFIVDGDFTLFIGGSCVWELAGPAVPVGLESFGAHVIVFSRTGFL